MDYSKMNWVAYSIIGAISLSCMILIYKKLLLLGINQLLLNLFIFGFVFIGFGIFVYATKTPIRLSPLMIFLLVIASVFSLIGNYFHVKAYNEAPNPGYAHALSSTAIILVMVLSVLLYGSNFTWLKFFGIITIILGSYLVSI